MSQLSGNSCNIITLLPLGVECESINASTPIVANGLITLFITGGTPPYTTTWNNGTQGESLFNLLPGSYTATTTDYYKDFSATTVCTVGYNSFYLEIFENCSNSAQTIYYLTTSPRPFITNKIYKLNNENGCWLNKGQTLFTGQTYNNTALINAGPYENCESCLPETITPIVIPSALCMKITTTSPILGTYITNIPLSSGSTINGKQSWTSVTPSYIVLYNSASTKWEVSGWTYNGNPSQNNTQLSPLGSWVVYGSNNISLQIESGSCVLTPFISVNTNKTSCDGVLDGSVTINASNGTPPYLYSIDNVIYNSSNMFIGLNNGNYTAYVKDNLNQIESQNFIIGSNGNPITYSLNLYQNPLTSPIFNNSGKYIQTTNYVEVSITPPLPNNKILTFDLVHSATFKKNGGIYNNIEILPTLQYNLTSGATAGVQITGHSTTIPIINTTSLVNCPLANNYSTGITETFNTVFSGNNTTLNFTVVKKITTPDADTSSCLTYGHIKDTFQIINPKILNKNKCESFETPEFLSFETDRIGYLVTSEPIGG